MKSGLSKTRIPVGVVVLVLVLGFAGHAPAAPARGTQGYLGVDIRDVTEDQVAALKLKEARGAEIVSVDHDGPGFKAGLQLHDVILQMNGQNIEGEEQLRRMLRETPAGRQVTFVVSRDGQMHAITTQLANREEVERKAWEQRYIVPEPEDASSVYIHAGNGFLKAAPSAPATGPAGPAMIVSSTYTGASLEMMSPQLAEYFGVQGSSGLLVRSVDANSPAASAGMKAGDVVVRVNAQSVASGADWVRTIYSSRGRPIRVVVIRDRKQQTLTLTPDEKKRSSLEMDPRLKQLFEQLED